MKMVRIKNKKGFDKAIEIFVFLFIIMVVGVIVLRMFNSQVSEKTETLSDITNQELMNQEIMAARSVCNTMCDDTKRSSCTNASMAAFCGNNVGPIDVDGNLKFTDWTDIIAGGVAVCEENIYCPLLVGCTCGGTDLNIDTCKDIISSHATYVGATIDADDAYPCGNCGTEPSNAWGCS
jgi:hypothetical protein